MIGSRGVGRVGGLRRWIGALLLGGAWGAARTLAQALSASRASTGERGELEGGQEFVGRDDNSDTGDRCRGSQGGWGTGRNSGVSASEPVSQVLGAVDVGWLPCAARRWSFAAVS